MTDLVYKPVPKEEFARLWRENPQAHAIQMLINGERPVLVLTDGIYFEQRTFH